MIRLYGHNSGSFKQVTDGLFLAFEELGVLEGVMVPEDQGVCGDTPSGGLAPVAVVVGDPLRVLMAHSLGLHEEVWLLLAPNSCGIPDRLRTELATQTWSPAKQQRVRAVTGFLAPSEWAAEVLRKEFPKHPVELCQHGVAPWFLPDAEQKEQLEILYAARQFSCLHTASTTLKRKGTRQLLEAWKQICTNSSWDMSLTLRVNPRFFGDLQKWVEEFECEDTTKLQAGQHDSNEEWVRQINSHHCVVQPSSAEGFGLIPLEALACGTPVAATGVTGHASYFLTNRDAIALVATGEPAESDDYWGATAPTVAVKDVLAALVDVRDNWLRYSQCAVIGSTRVRSRNTWTRGATNVVNIWKEKYGKKQR